MLASDDRFGLLRRLDRHGFVAFVLQDARQGLANPDLVVDDENAAGHVRRLGTARYWGISMVKTEPCGGLSSTRIVPW